MKYIDGYEPKELKPCCDYFNKLIENKLIYIEAGGEIALVAKNGVYFIQYCPICGHKFYNNTRYSNIKKLLCWLGFHNYVYTYDEYKFGVSTYYYNCIRCGKEKIKEH
jgi:DNA-directed RNA polymerase subunit RPC12/RpoP